MNTKENAPTGAENASPVAERVLALRDSVDASLHAASCCLNELRDLTAPVGDAGSFTGDPEVFIRLSFVEFFTRHAQRIIHDVNPYCLIKQAERKGTL